MKYTVKFFILLGIFIGSIYFFGSNMDEAMFGTVKTAVMTEAKLPTIQLQSDGVVVNTLYGYTSAIDAFSIRENLVAVEAEQTVELLINENETDVRKLHYEVLDVSTRAEIAEGTINAFDKEENQKKARIKITNKMESGKEYAVELMLVDSESRRIYYYFRMKRYDNSEFAEKVQFIRDFSDWAFSKNETAVIPFLESTYRGEGSSYAQVDIKDSFFMVCWGKLQPKRLTEPKLTISEIYSNIAVGTLDYMVEISTDSGVETYYVKEKFRVIVSGTSKHLLNYERTMETVFDAELASLSQNQFKLGITNHTDMELLTNKDASQLAFVRNKELWHYNMAENMLYKVFSFRSEKEEELGLSYNQYDVRILKLYENGDISFMVYGHMGKGDYEGKTGILLYRYYRGEERMEEQLYLPVSETYQKIKEELGAFSYMNEYDVFFFMVYNTMYSYNLITKELTVVSEQALEDSVVFFKDSGYVCWQEEGYAEIQLLQLESGEKKELTAAPGEFIRILGKINENLICGYGLLSDCMEMVDGSVLYPAYEIKILNDILEEKKTYRKEGYYVAEAEITPNSICLRRVEKTETGGYAEAPDDYILNSTEAKKRPVTLDKRITEQMFAEYYIDLPSTYAMKEIPVPEIVPYTLISEDITVRIDALENDAEEYMVYSFGEMILLSDDCAEAVRLADQANVVGTVVNEAGQVIWERGIKYASASVSLEEGAFATTASMDDFVKYAAGNRVLKLTGVTLDEALYFVFRGAPVYAMKNRTDAVIITGYTATNITVYEPASGKNKTYSLKDAENLFEAAGNFFLTYVK